MATARLMFGDYRPDMPPLAGGVAIVADNVLPGPEGYRPVPQFVALPGTALPSYPLGAGSFRASDRSTTTFAGTATNLYQYSATGWTSVGSGYNASLGNPWEFEQFGQWVIATNGADAPQYFDLAAPGAGFTALPGTGGTNPPRMNIVAIVRDFVVGGVINGNAAMIHWSGINNASEWRPSYGQCDYNPFATGGSVTAIAGGEYGLVFQEDRISRMTYVAGNVIFQFDEISPNIGCVHPRAFVQLGRACYFLSPRGFMLCDGNGVTPIGDERVDRTFLAAMDRGYLGRMSCVADPVRKVIYWSVPAAEPSIWYAYSWALQRWSRVSAPCRLLVSGRTRDISLDETYGTPDTGDTGLSFDDPAYLGGDPVFYVFDATNTLGALTGANMAATLSTPLVQPVTGSVTRARRAGILGDAGSGLTLTLDGRLRMSDAASVSVSTSYTTEGDMPARARGRFMSATLAIAAGTAWTFAKGVVLDVRNEGGGW